MNCSSLRVCSHWLAKFSAECARLAIAQHPFDLGEQVLAATQRSLRGHSKELLVGHAAPEEVRETRGQSEVIDGLNRHRIAIVLGSF